MDLPWHATIRMWADEGLKKMFVQKELEAGLPAGDDDDDVAVSCIVIRPLRLR